MVGNLAVNDSRKTALQLFAAALLCAIGTTLLSLWFFRFYADIDDGRSPHSLFVVVASVFVIAAGPRLVASFTAKHLAYLSLIGIFVGAFLAVAVPAWAPVGSGVTAIAGTFLEIFVYKSLLSLSNATMRKVFVTATVGGIFAGSALPLDAPTALFAASVCMALAVALAASRLDLGPETSEGRGAPSVHVRRQIILRVRPAAGLIVLAFVAHLASANAAPLGPGLTGGAYLAALALLWLSAIAHDDTSHISLIRCLVLISAVVCAMRLSGGFGAEAVAFVETALGIIVWTGIIVVALDLATYAEVPFSTIMGGVYLLLTGPAALIYLMSLAAPRCPQCSPPASPTPPSSAFWCSAVSTCSTSKASTTCSGARTTTKPQPAERPSRQRPRGRPSPPPAPSALCLLPRQRPPSRRPPTPSPGWPPRRS